MWLGLGIEVDAEDGQVRDRTVSRRDEVLQVLVARCRRGEVKVGLRRIDDLMFLRWSCRRRRVLAVAVASRARPIPMCWAERHSGVQAVVIEDARCRREQGGVAVVLAQEWCRRPAKEPVHGWDGERRRWRRGRSCDIGGDLLDTLSIDVHSSLAWVAAAAATVTTAVQDEGAAMAALSRTATAGLGQSKSARVTAAVAVAAEADAMALAAEASTATEAAETSIAVSKAMATCEG